MRNIVFCLLASVTCICISCNKQKSRVNEENVSLTDAQMLSIQQDLEIPLGSSVGTVSDSIKIIKREFIKYDSGGYYINFHHADGRLTKSFVRYGKNTNEEEARVEGVEGIIIACTTDNCFAAGGCEPQIKNKTCSSCSGKCILTITKTRGLVSE